MPRPYPKDCIGNDIKPGYIVLYPVRNGSAMWMSLGVVIESKTKKNRHGKPRTYINVWTMGSPSWETNWEVANIDWERASVRCLDRVTVLKEIGNPALRSKVGTKVMDVLYENWGSENQ